MTRPALLVLLFLLFTPLASSSPPSSPSETHQGSAVNQLAKQGLSEGLSETKLADLIDPRWQAAAKKWGAWAQVEAQTWGSKVGEWGQAGAEKLKASELGKGFQNLPGVWHASVAAVEKVLPERGRGRGAEDEVTRPSENFEVKERETLEKTGLEICEASSEGGQAAKGVAVPEGDANVEVDVGTAGRGSNNRKNERGRLSKQSPGKAPAVQHSSDGFGGSIAGVRVREDEMNGREARAKPAVLKDERVAWGAQSGLAAGLGRDAETEQIKGKHSEGTSSWKEMELESPPLQPRGIPSKNAPLGEVTEVFVGSGDPKGGQGGKVARWISVGARDAQINKGGVDGGEPGRLPAVRTVEARSIVEFEEWLQRERLRKASLDESPEAAKTSTPDERLEEKKREGFDVVVLLVGGLCLASVFGVVRMLNRSFRWVAGCVRKSSDTSQGEAIPALVRKEGLVSGDGENVMVSVETGLVETNEGNKDRLGQQLGAALGSATGSLMAEALRPLSDPAVLPLTPEELAQKLEAVCTSALSIHVGDFATDALITELVRSFSRTYRTLTALHSSTPGGSRPRTPLVSGRPHKPSGQSPRSPLDREGPSEHDASLSDEDRTVPECDSSSKPGVLVTEEILRIGREYGANDSSSEEEESAEVSVTRNYTVDLEPGESRLSGAESFPPELREGSVEDVMTMGEAASAPSQAFGAVSGGRGETASASGALESDPPKGESSDPCVHPPKEVSSGLFTRFVDEGGETQSAGPVMNAGLHEGEVDVHERWSFAGSTARHRKTRRRRGAENGVGRQLLFGGVSEASETGGVLTLRSHGGVSLQSAYVERARSVSVGSRSVEMELAERSVAAQEQAVVNQLVANRLKMRELELQNQQLGLTTEGLALTSEGLALKTEGLGLKSESNFVGRQRNELEREKVRMHAARHAEARAGAFARRCADELVAGLVVMVTALVWAGFRYGYPNLRAKLHECRAVQVAPSRSLFGRFGLQAVSDNLAGKLQVLGCQIAVTGRLGMGLVVGGFMASLLLRQNVAGSVRVMPSTVLLLVLGAACGYAGKQAVDSVGGSGICWLVLWETLCALHTLALFPTGFVSSLLYPPADARQQRPLFVSPWVAQLTFHATVVAILPVAAGVLPFLWV
ncbi:hypothetical protein KFL_001850260 [Klebsormidium nitens]|uniref:Uncharacterized protein n=1 Tax=Klebsormidium nitens TaxID=105231 RepID=A0A1Y1I314_KLENI|nr:hypothetical protein KFL_001850260 [Klebsormidium nitens]|eukprot:GAQ84352.1 hypothetical protein KFL_001850260 [Klebsormidium nitens]